MVSPAGASLRSYRFRPPNPQSGQLSRPRLTDILEAKTTAHPTTLVIAPSGYGKTSVAAEWAATHEGRVAWLTLGPFDVDGGHLGASALLALQALARSTGAPDLAGLLSFDAGGLSPSASFDLIDEALVDLDEPIHLVIDDAHRAEDGLSTGLLGALLEGACESLRVVVVGTSYVEIALSRLVLQSPGAVIRSGDLAFDVAEIERLQPPGQQPFTAEAVLGETGGWPIAVRAMQVAGARPDGAGEGQDTVLRRYIDEHVLGALPDDIEEFVRSTALCGMLTSELATAITGNADAGELLERCATMGLFLDRFETPSGPLYRWHDVISRQCDRILEQHDPDARRTILRAVAMHLATTDPLTSARYWMRADDTDAAVQTILARWPRLVVGSEAGSLDRWCAALPLPFGDDPRILTIRACVQDVIGHRDVARMLWARAEASAAGHEPATDLEELRARARLFLLDDRAELIEAGAAVRAQLEAPDRVELGDRAALQYLLGWSELRCRTSPALMVQFFSTAATDAAAAGDHTLARRSLGHLAHSLAWAGRLREADDVLAQRLELVDEGSWASYAGGSAATAAAFAAYWRDDQEQAIAAAQRAIRSGGAAISFPGAARLVLAFAAAASRDPQACQRAAREVQGLPTETLQGIEWQSFRHAAFATLNEAAGRRELALKIVAKYENATDLPLITVVLAGIASRAGHPRTAEQMLRRLEAYDAISYVRVSRLLAEAVLLWREDRRSPARVLVEEALEVAAPEQLRRPFAAAGLDARQLLTEQLAWGTSHDQFLTGCLTVREASGPLQSLSDRERDVFAQLRSTRTMQEIADAMGVSINTVKTHQRAIYRKLGVASRREAVRLFT
ncbi:LuxR C-terminal-related transcriptional regulator [Microbacterium sp. KUDC0406]|uniref:LuxR C-terminal-related transcriptional regulator n=1 Tax=Microbacterium sp. KUDC0406 TaxID=2909588 RepID=UPI001F163F7B|nr:LuxR C-terminal-related transcriptional regulator [Microbacterium sp. KUDC0406]UJP11077.1 LuxR C-terminal-related transcriptional regulator [Microbacterium sp. KUDC0406]